jgi:hypothetical protein
LGFPSIAKRDWKHWSNQLVDIFRHRFLPLVPMDYYEYREVKNPRRQPLDLDAWTIGFNQLVSFGRHLRLIQLSSTFLRMKALSQVWRTLLWT